jgi:hypothetical protein
MRADALVMQLQRVHYSVRGKAAQDHSDAFLHEIHFSTPLPMLASNWLGEGGSMLYSIIRSAIERRESLSGKYDDYVRHFSPHVLGEDRQGDQAVLGFQYGGGRPGGLPVHGDWCFFKLAQLTARPNGDQWVSGPCGKPLHLFSRIDVQV